jgi:signal transduction histidine kinase
VQVSFQPVHSLPEILTTSDFIQQILLNLIFNAAESMKRNPEIVLRTHLFEKPPSELVLFPESAPAYVAISVQDFGSGISLQNLQRIFEPFFTTKAFSTRRGTGLGLSMVYELAKRLGAGLAVDSAVDQGSTFTLFLPVRTPPATSKPYEPANDPGHRG